MNNVCIELSVARLSVCLSSSVARLPTYLHINNNFVGLLASGVLETSQYFYITIRYSGSKEMIGFRGKSIKNQSKNIDIIAIGFCAFFKCYCS